MAPKSFLQVSQRSLSNDRLLLKREKEFRSDLFKPGGKCTPGSLVKNMSCSQRHVASLCVVHNVRDRDNLTPRLIGLFGYTNRTLKIETKILVFSQVSGLTGLHGDWC